MYIKYLVGSRATNLYDDNSDYDYRIVVDNDVEFNPRLGEIPLYDFKNAIKEGDIFYSQLFYTSSIETDLSKDVLDKLIVKGRKFVDSNAENIKSYILYRCEVREKQIKYNYNSKYAYLICYMLNFYIRLEKYKDFEKAMKYEDNELERQYLISIKLNELPQMEVFNKIEDLKRQVKICIN